MWCKGCRQDVPALPSGDRQTLCCSRCGEAISANPHEAATEECPSFRGHRGEAVGDEKRTGPFGVMDQLPAYDGWELDEQLRQIERTLHVGEASGKADSPIFSETKIGTIPREARFDPPQDGPPARHLPASDRPGKQRRTAGNRGPIPSLFTWIVLTLGTTGFACGGVLLAWSLATGRQELWSVGLPAALVGQIALLGGLVLQIDRLWHDNREAAAKLDYVDEQIHELKATTLLLSTSQGQASATFYSHLARGAGPQLLLTDLKSQLDLLAMKIAQEG